MHFRQSTSALRPRLFSLISIAFFVAAGLLGASVFLRESLAKRTPDAVATTAAATDRTDQDVAQAYGKLPLSFERNDGQFAEPVKFVANGIGYSLFLTPQEAVLTLRGKSAAAETKAGSAAKPIEGYKVIRLKLVGANSNAAVIGLEELSGKRNYFIGNDPARWTTDVPLYSKVHYQQVYDGIDLLYYGNQRQLEYDFQVAPGGDPRAIKLEIAGAERINVDKKDGSLVLGVDQSEVRFKKPVVYQVSNEGNRREIEGGYSVNGKVVQFQVANFDASKPLVIDPILSYSTYLGASATGWGIAVDSSGSAYVTGAVGTNFFPTTGVNFIPNDNSSGHAFVTKFNPAGSALIYSTMIGGTSSDIAFGIAVDTSGSAVITGRTNSTNFPTLNALRSNETNLIKSLDSGSSWASGNAGLGTGQISRLVVDPSSPSTVYALSGGLYKSTDSGATWTLVNTGGVNPGFSGVGALAIDPQTPTTLYAGIAGSSSSSVIKSIDGGATWLPANTGLNGTSVFGLGIDPQNPSTLYAGGSFDVYKSTNGGSSWARATSGFNYGDVHAFVFAPANSSIVYAAAGGNGGIFKTTNAGGNWVRSNTDMTATFVRGLVLDPITSTLYVSTIGGGVFKSVNGAGNWTPVNVGLTRQNVNCIAIVPGVPATLYVGTNSTALFKSTNSGDTWSQIYGGLSTPQITAVAVNPAAPAKVYAGIDMSISGSTFDTEAFVTKLNPAGNALVFSTYLGGGGNEDGLGIAVDSSGNIVVTGQTESSDFPVANPRQANLSGTMDAFITKFVPNGTSLVYSTYLGGSSSESSRGVAIDSSGSAYVAGVTASPNFPTTPGAFQTSLANGQFQSDAFVTKIDAAGNSYVYSTYLGGNDADAAFGIAIDSGGNALVAGSTGSSNYPLVNPAVPVIFGSTGAFVSKLNPAGSALVYSSILGGDSLDQARGIAVDATGNAYITGITGSSNFPITQGSLRSRSSFYQTTNGGAVWKNDNQGLGTALRDIALNPTTLVLFAATDTGVYKSNNLGITWLPATNGLTNLRTSILAVDPTTPDTVYVGGGNSGGGIYKTTNSGGSWISINGNQPFTSIAAIAVDPVTPATIYLSDYSNAYKTTNGGNTWIPVGIGQLSSVTSLAVDKQNPQIIYATINSSTGGVLKSFDGGATWSPSNIGLNAFANTVVIDPSSSSTLYVGTNVGVFKSVNSGANWTNVVSISLVNNITIDPLSPATLYATSYSPSPTGSAISRSFNGGANWTAVGSGTINTAGRLLVNPQIPNTLYVLGNPGFGDDDVFVSKFTPAGNLAYSTYLGGSLSPQLGNPAADWGFAIAADAAGNAYVTGLAASIDFPVTPDSYQPFLGGCFVTKLSDSFSISGVVTNAGATPQGGVKITLSGSATNSLLTGVDGSYAFNNLQPGGNYTVSATRTGFSFAPPSQTFNNLSANQTANFTLSPSGTPFHTISGRIAEADNTAIPGVTVSLTGSQIEFATTNSTGNYSFSAPDGGNYTVTPTALGFVFSPPSQFVNNLSANTQRDFTGTRQDFVVTNTNDRGAGSLRQAIINANLTFGADRIVFQIPGSGVQTIRPVSTLPEIIDPVTIDGTTQPGSGGSLLIELDGSTSSSSQSGLTISCGNSTVRGMVINRYGDSAINLKTVGGNHIEGNIIGLDPTGSIIRRNQNGISINVSAGNFIGGVTPAQRNLISGNGRGIYIVAGASQIKGNYIGTNAAGTTGLGNGYGILMENFSGLPPSTSNQIGGTETGARNLISGNSIGIETSGLGTIIQGNLIGTDVSGTTKVGNDTIGVKVRVSEVVLGGTTPAARNIISGNGEGVEVGLFFGPDPFIIFKGNYIGTDITGNSKLGNTTGVSFSGRGTIGGTEAGAGNLISGNDGAGIQLNGGAGISTVQGNLIGTNATGLLPLGNGMGITIQASQNIIGGSAAGARNVISGNGIGIQIGGLVFPGPFANVVQGNYIGVNALGNAPLGNTSRGIELNDSSNTIIGGDQPGEGNFLAFNSFGVVTSTSVVNSVIKGNSIFSNVSLGIDLNFDGVVTANDPGDADSGGNRLQNFPLVSSITPGGGSTNVKGSLNSTASTQFRIDFYSNLACDLSGNGEGGVPFGFTTVTTDVTGNAAFDVNLTGQLAANRTITATATDPAGNTSEFSPCNAAGTAGSLEFSAFDYNVLEDAGNAVIKLVRTGGSRGTLTVNYSTGSGTATAGVDYTAASGSFSFADGETEKTFNIPIVSDGASEPEETVGLNLSGLADLESFGARYHATLHIFDSNTALTISGGDAQIVEGDVGQRNVLVPVTLSAANGQTVTVNYLTVAGGSSSNASSGRDFVATSGTLTFAPGVETQNIQVPILADVLDEFDETFIVTLTGAVNASVVRTSLVKIFDDDAMPTLSVTDVSVVEASGANAVFSVRLSAPSGRTVSFSYATANGTATSGSDYTSRSGVIGIAAGQTVLQISVPILTDGTVEPDETFVLNLMNPQQAIVADAQGVGTIIDASASTTVIGFSAATYAANEVDGQVPITVTRSGNTSSESLVSYRTTSGSASDRSDFTPSIGTLRFAAGETSKTFNVLITDDAFLELSESVSLGLSNPVGGVLGGPNVATLNITSNDASDGPSPVREQSFDTHFFVRQHYHDFLNREPDAAGLDFWSNEIDSCTTDACREIRKINVSAAFFLSIEFQETGYLAYRMYNAAYGETTSPNVSGTVPIIRLQEFLPDSQQIGQGVQVGIGNWQQQLETNKVAYALDFVQRQRFIDAFPLAMTADEFVNKLDQNTNGVLSSDEKAQLVAMLGAIPADAQKRSVVVRSVAEDSGLRTRELNRAFVLMQYYGYLRRNPDDPQDTDFRGWKFWLDKLNQFNGNFADAEMVKSFLVSGEYRQRFGTP